MGRRIAVRLDLGKVAVALAALLLLPGSAAADFHLVKIREVHPGGAANSSYVVLQAYAAGQNNLAPTHHIDLYGPTGSLVTTFTFATDPPSGQDQATVLVADSGYAATFPSGPAPDATHAALDIPAAGGAVCFDAPDCVSWGNFSGSLPSPAGSPASPSGVTAGKALHRSIAAGCATLLEADDDTNSSVADFSEQNPNPRSSATAIVETECLPAPNTAIGTKPPSVSNSTSATFSFTASPAAEATFECKLDAEPSFTACTSPKEYTGLAGGSGTSHTFQVRAVHPTNGTDPSPASYTWTIDTVAPTATIQTQPPDPSPGNKFTFTYSSNETGTFECSLVPAADPDSFSLCPFGTRTYTNVTDGEYTFKVRAKDLAGNVGAADSYTWEVDNALNDVTAPTTVIVSKPPNPSASPTAAFTYQSSEAGSTFECQLDGGAFVGCDAAGVTYFGLSNGSHSFQVRARDQVGNLGSPASYGWEVAVPAFEPPVLLPPPLPPLASAAEPPQTILTRKPGAVTRDRTPSFRFRSSQAGGRFGCKVDKGRFRPCSSPFTTKVLSFGPHTVQVRAVVAGLADPTPARSAFRVLRRRAR
jgi:hypothetical protein